ncbi:uncharacterized protein LOC130783637 [Actinidia eriantha]|uniref:uncharacterized protein LOC130783637 n=1 Tax=Actinidia eriantha TaxID=165200 RepID=UPI00258BF7A2|nr:uncharacterized protein LOC130783637 [Actinidia eriantha]
MKLKYSYQEPNQDNQPLASLQSNRPKLLPQQFLSQQELQLPRIPGGATALPPLSTVPRPTLHHQQLMQPTLTNHYQTRPLLPLPFLRRIPPPHQEPPKPTLLSASNNPFMWPPTKCRYQPTPQLSLPPPPPPPPIKPSPAVAATSSRPKSTSSFSTTSNRKTSLRHKSQFAANSKRSG